ncbi:ubiquinone anaerobic biosynthesis protein UbiU [endosymbiont of Ridgeia piscesae]|jgi:putative protease|uniref:Ubiquinone biosynthesis protein UbiU n=1 Tax=endosymbiont of Ridgeia piscesae TaxID=54398 RepID=A0A0T5Z7Q7_9GAMM|nr:peptidase U32 family protein [endosymbiont of Ridgeia piscesae]KRT54758.1 Collagenase-like protease, PrtC family [endosymbiont of Ridgeia piscesae]KRT58795.1 putative protease [endosymbiont of Ridgeia piscesae]
MELVCPAGNLPSLKAAVDNGADAVYIGLRDDTNARHFPGLNFNQKRASDGIAYARRKGVRVFMAINTYPRPDGWQRWQQAVDSAADLGVDALICADIGVLDYASSRWPDLNLHLSVQASSTNYEALRFYHDHFGIKRAVLPRVLSLPQVKHVVDNSPVGIEVFGFGSLCVMVEGRCILSSYVTGESPNTQGACSPAKYVEWKDGPQGMESRLNGVLTDRYQEGEQAGYPTICKGRFEVGDNTFYAIEEPTSLNTLELLPELMAAGVEAIKIEGRQRSPAYVAQVAQVWRQAIDSCQRDPETYRANPAWNATLGNVSEGTQTTLGPYHRPWQ